MTYLFIGAGQAGGAIVDDIFEYTNSSLFGLFDSTDLSAIAQPLAFNSTMRDLQNLSNIDKSNQYGIAESHGLINGTEPGFEEKVAGGFGRSPVDANETMSGLQSELERELKQRFGGRSVATDGGTDSDQDSNSSSGILSNITSTGSSDGGSKTDSTSSTSTIRDKNSDNIQFAFIFFGLGGGTGCGISPVIAESIKEVTRQDVKIVAVPILPNIEGNITSDKNGEVTPGRQAWNARYGLNKIEKVVDGIILIDNQRISYLDSAGGEFGDYNQFVASAFHDMVAGPLLTTLDPSEFEDIDTPDIDVRDIVTSLSFGVSGSETTPGYGAIGRSVVMTKSLPGYLIPYVGKKNIDTDTLVRMSTAKQTLDNIDIEDAYKAISLVRAPKRNLGPTGNSIKTGTIKKFLEHKCGLNEVNLGVAVTDRNIASITTILTYKREEIERITEIEKAAEQYEKENQRIAQ